MEKTWFLDMGAFSWQNATYTIQFSHIDNLHQKWKTHVARKMRSCWIFQLQVWKNWEKQQRLATPLLFDHSEQACSVLYPETKYNTWNYK